MKLTFLGTGSAFTLGCNNFQSNVVLESQNNGTRLLIDCGSDARFSLYEQGLSYKDINAVFISHLHSDHVGGLDWLAFSTRFDKKNSKIKLYIHEYLVKDLWDHVLSGILCSIQGENATLSSYFDVHIIKKNQSFTWEGIQFYPIQTIHAMSENMILPSFGLFFCIGQNQIYFTTDTQFAPHQILSFYKKATLIFQDCETSLPPSGVHAQFQELDTLPLEIKQKMWLYHYNPGNLPEAEKHGFLGFVKKGQSFLFE